MKDEVPQLEDLCCPTKIARNDHIDCIADYLWLPFEAAACSSPLPPLHFSLPAQCGRFH